MQIRKVSARDMIEEENLKPKTKLLDIIKFSPAAQLQPRAWYIVRGKDGVRVKDRIQGVRQSPLQVLGEAFKDRTYPTHPYC